MNRQQQQSIQKQQTVQQQSVQQQQIVQGRQTQVFEQQQIRRTEQHVRQVTSHQTGTYRMPNRKYRAYHVGTYLVSVENSHFT